MEEYSEDNKAYIAADNYGPVSRKVIIVAGADLVKGTILGAIANALDVVAADAGNTGDGAVSGAALGLKAQLGDYVLSCTATVVNGGTFQVVAPDGSRLPDATVGSAYANAQINFTINDGAADFGVGDKFTVPVVAGSKKLKAYKPANVDGSQNPVAVLLEAAAAAAVDVEAVVGYAGVYVKDNMTGLDAAAEDALAARGLYFT